MALAWPSHQFHEAAVARLEREPSRRWATCALTQLGFIRVSCNVSVTRVRQSPSAASDMLVALTSDRQHVYVESLPPPAGAGRLFERIVGHQQVTDAYLVGLSRSIGAMLLTFDRRLLAVGPERKDIEVLAGAGS